MMRMRTLEEPPGIQREERDGELAAADHLGEHLVLGAEAGGEGDAGAKGLGGPRQHGLGGQIAGLRQPDGHPGGKFR
jgi:hypothetical protein